MVQPPLSPTLPYQGERERKSRGNYSGTPRPEISLRLLEARLRR